MLTKRPQEHIGMVWQFFWCYVCSGWLSKSSPKAFSVMYCLSKLYLIHSFPWSTVLFDWLTFFFYLSSLIIILLHVINKTAAMEYLTHEYSKEISVRKHWAYLFIYLKLIHQLFPYVQYPREKWLVKTSHITMSSNINMSHASMMNSTLVLANFIQWLVMKLQSYV